MPAEYRSLYAYFLENHYIESIRDFDADQLHVTPSDVLQKLQSSDPAWEALVPPQVARLIKERALFGYRAATAVISQHSLTTSDMDFCSSDRSVERDIHCLASPQFPVDIRLAHASTGSTSPVPSSAPRALTNRLSLVSVGTSTKMSESGEPAG